MDQGFINISEFLNSGFLSKFSSLMISYITLLTLASAKGVAWKKDPVCLIPHSSQHLA
jgi:hypothetical protein